VNFSREEERNLVWFIVLPAPIEEEFGLVYRPLIPGKREI